MIALLSNESQRFVLLNYIALELPFSHSEAWDNEPKGGLLVMGLVSGKDSCRKLITRLMHGLLEVDITCSQSMRSLVGVTHVCNDRHCSSVLLPFTSVSYHGG